VNAFLFITILGLVVLIVGFLAAFIADRIGGEK